MRTSMHDQYGDTSQPTIRRSTFDVSETHKHTWNVSNIIPICWAYLTAGEIRRGKVRAFVRLSNPLQFPLMDNLYITVHVLSIPIRNIWDSARRFFGERENPGDTIDFTIPTLSGTFALNGDSGFQRLADHLGLPHVALFDGTDASALPFRAYLDFWNYWYRDNSIQNAVAFNKTDGPDGTTPYVLQQRGKRFDYYTNILPEPQRGDAVTIGGEIATDLTAGGEVSVYATAHSESRKLDHDGTYVNVSGAGGTGNELYPNTTINELRNAAAIQHFLENDNRAGQLFGDILYARFGANFTDSKYASTFIAGGRAPFIFNAISNQAAKSGPTGSEQELGELAAIGTSVFEGASFTYRADEPELFMVMAMVDADLTYSQGLQRKWSYRTRYDFLNPEFDGIGDQAMLKKELYYQNNASDDLVMGYSPRYEEHRIGVNMIHREFRPDYATPLDTWHLSQDFTTEPSLNGAYIISQPPLDRVLVNNTVDNLIGDFHVEMFSTIPLSQRGVPGLARL